MHIYVHVCMHLCISVAVIRMGSQTISLVCVYWRTELMALQMLSTDWATSPVLLFLLSIKFIVHLNLFFEKESHMHLKMALILLPQLLKY